MTGTPQICPPTAEAIAAAAAALRRGELVGMPTETVYGLAAAIDQEPALQAVFTYKQRPFEDPLIVHVLQPADAWDLWNVDAPTRALLQCLMQNFWPGPLTLIARAQDRVSRLVRGGGNAVGVRSPQHPVARALIAAAAVPLAAPSANLFGHVSPTRAQHVADDFSARPLLILDGDKSRIGIESTVLKVEEGGRLFLLRHGAISPAHIMDALQAMGLQAQMNTKEPGQSAKKVEAPGQYLRHYAPHTPAWMLSPGAMPDGFLTREVLPLSRSACLDFAGRFAAEAPTFSCYRDLAVAGDSKAAAQALFEELRILEQESGHQIILLPELNPHAPAEQALYDRIFRACEGKRAAIVGRDVHLS